MYDALVGVGISFWNFGMGFGSQTSVYPAGQINA